MDVEKIHGALMRAGAQHGLTTYTSVARALGLSTNTLTRLGYGQPPDAHNTAAILYYIDGAAWWITPKI